MQSAETDASLRFGLSLAGVNLLTPPDRPSQFVASAAIYPLPLAPRRVRGLTQVRGHPVTVLDLGRAAPAFLPTFQRHNLLVIGDPAESSMAVLVDEPPRAIRVKPWDTEPPGMPDEGLPFVAALRSPQYELDDPEQHVWWQADFAALFATLMAER